MRQGFRRTIGLGGAAFVAVGAALVLTLPASAHTHNISADCNQDTGVIELSISLTNYKVDTSEAHRVNTIVATDTLPDGTVLKLVPMQDFGMTFPSATSTPSSKTGTLVFDTKSTPAIPTNVASTFDVKVVAWDDKDAKGNSQGFSTEFQQTVKPCKETPPPPTTTNAPTTTTVPPTTRPAATTTTTAVVAAASSQLPNTGVNAGMPLLIAGVLVVAGGGILLWLRMAAKRRSTNN